MNKVVLLTGANGRLGSILLQKLQDQGYIIYAGVRGKSDIKKNKNVIPVSLDVTDSKSCEAIIQKIIKDQKNIDVLINNAAVTKTGPTLDFSKKDYLDILKVNTVGPFTLAKLVAPQMKKQGGGKIINITSVNGRVALPNFGLYSASKHALEAFGRSIRYELLPDNISVTNIAPGAIKTEQSTEGMSHKPLRERYWLAYKLLPMVTQDEVALKVLEVIQKKNPPASILMGRDAWIAVFVEKYLPVWLKDMIIKLTWKNAEK